ncbi:MAG: hypothetical protein WAO23_06295, partial [Dethiobacteria bacterium]
QQQNMWTEVSPGREIPFRMMKEVLQWLRSFGRYRRHGRSLSDVNINKPVAGVITFRVMMEVLVVVKILRSLPLPLNDRKKEPLPPDDNNYFFCHSERSEES